MKRLSRKKVFCKYNTTLTNQLAHSSYSLYKKVRIGMSRFFPLNNWEKCCLKDLGWRDAISDAMPLGYNLFTKKSEDGYLNLEYLDFYDYLPKENLDIFKKELKQCVAKNKLTPFGPFRTSKDMDLIDNMGRYIDCRAFSNLLGVEFCHNKNLEQYASQVAISLRNLSASFLVVKYRFCINKTFNKQFNDICKAKFHSFSDVSKQFNIPWYQPWRFGRAIHRGNDARTKALYELITELKWRAFAELKHYFTIHFEHNQMFPPTFETYSTNIRPNNNWETRGFWDSVMLEPYPDYAPRYNACVSWRYRPSQEEGIRCAAYCGGSYSDSDYQEDAQHEIANIYALYMTADSLNKVAERDIALCNKRISKVIRNSRTIPILKARVDIEKKLYYSYRFISEFTGDTIDYDEATVFRSHIYKGSSITKRRLNSISKITMETKNQIDALLTLLNDAAEYGSAKSNIRLQWFMMVVTVLSVIVAILAMVGLEKLDFKALWDAISGYFR